MFSRNRQGNSIYPDDGLCNNYKKNSKPSRNFKFPVVRGRKVVATRDGLNACRAFSIKNVLEWLNACRHVDPKEGRVLTPVR